MEDLKYKRFFAFGCSYTHFVWPTWARIIADDLNIPFENWGLSGSGNQAIQSRLVECDFKNNLTNDDLIIIAWSSWSREDRYIDSNWRSGGNIFNNLFFDDAFIKKYWSWENDVIKNSTAMHMTNKAYKDIITYQMSMTHYPTFERNIDIIDWIRQKTIGKPPTDSVELFYKNKLNVPPLMELGKNSRFNNVCMDTHPDIKSHLYVVENQIYPKLGLTLKQTTKDKYMEMFDRIVTVLSKNDEYNIMVKKVHGVLSSMNIDVDEHVKHHGF
jgi:hypothetical protein